MAPHDHRGAAVSENRRCGAAGVDAEGHCLRCGLVAPDPALDTETECPPGFFDGYPLPDEFPDDGDDADHDYTEEDVVS